MKNFAFFLCFLAAALAAGGCAAARPGEITCGGVYPQHLQGVAMNADGEYFWSYTNKLVKTGHDGKVMAVVEVGDHHGDLTLDDDFVYVSSSVIHNYERGAESSSVIAYRQGDLSKAAEYPISDEMGCDGIAKTPHGFVVAVLPNPPIDQTTSLLREYDENFNFIAEHELITPPTYSGVQTLARIGNGYAAGCYGRHFYLLDKNFNVKKRFVLDAAIGAIDCGDGVIAVAELLGDRPAYGAKLKLVKLSELEEEPAR